MKDIESTLLECCRSGKKIEIKVKGHGSPIVVAKEIRNGVGESASLYCYTVMVDKLGDVGGIYEEYNISDITDVKEYND